VSTQSSFSHFEKDLGRFTFAERADELHEIVNDLTRAEAEALAAVKYGHRGPREFARETDRSPGTVGNLLASGREKVGGE
jgi:DNA-directed RNA polymerase specialized sigma24 family protein